MTVATETEPTFTKRLRTEKIRVIFVNIHSKIILRSHPITTNVRLQLKVIILPIGVSGYEL
jgi:hypothetical protein